MPQVDEWNETDTPGLFLAGEVRGLALVRNAIEPGPQGGGAHRASAVDGRAARRR